MSECRIGAAAPTSQTLALLTFAVMAPVPQEFVTVEMRGLKAALIARSRADRVSVSGLVRAFVARGLGQNDGAAAERSRDAGSPTRTRLSIRVSAVEAQRFTSAARSAGLSRAAYLAELIDDAPEVVNSATRSAQLAALAATNADLSTLSRNLRHLAALLGQGSLRAAQEYRGMLDTVAGDVRRHLSVAAAVLADTRTRQLPAEAAKRRSSKAPGELHGSAQRHRRRPGPVG